MKLFTYYNAAKVIPPFIVMTTNRICNCFALNQEIDRKGLPEYLAAKHVQWNEAQSPVHCPEKSQNWVS